MGTISSKKLVVSDLVTSLNFYQEVMQFEVVFQDLEKKTAMVQSPSKQTVLLVGDDSQNVSQWLTTAYDAPKPGKSLYFAGGDQLVEFKNRLLQFTQYHVMWEEKEWGDYVLQVTDPDGYILSFWGSKELSFDEILAYYEEAPARLKKAIEGLSEEDLDLTRAPGKWSIRQIVLHITDSDATSLAITKFALAEPGRQFNPNSYNPDVWAEGLDYANRPIDAEVELFTAIRRHIAGLLRHLPNAFDRTVQFPNGSVVKVIDRIRPIMSHPLGHIEQILETRRVQGK